jgi:two-component system, OmpR family, response regulator
VPRVATWILGHMVLKSGRLIVVYVRVLVVDDEVRTATLLRRGLAEEGYAVDVAGDAGEAMWRATEFGYDVVVLDVLLPGMDGFEVCRALRASGCWAPVLMLTARDAVEDRVRGLDAGADDYLTKPFSFSELAARIRALIRRGSAERPVVLQVGDLRLDPAQRQVWLGQAEVALSATEFALLELFLRHPGQVLSRARILEHVWDYGYDGASNVVDQYVGYLRRKIDRPFGVDYLETVRGAGYRLRAQGPASPG